MQPPTMFHGLMR